MINKQKNRNLHSKKDSRPLRRQSRKMQRGQILIIVVFAIVGLVAFVGLVVDTGLVFIGNGKLRRATDSAALAAAAAYRKYPDKSRLNEVAMEYLTLNNVDNGGADIHLLCDPTDPQYDATQCSPAKRRLVKVDTTSNVNLAFLPVIGIRTVPLNATATSEAASLDIVLAIDVSESMTWRAPQYGDLMRDPGECNKTLSLTDYSNCQPFKDIQQAAVGFIDTIFPSDNSNTYDRVAVIPFERTVHFDKTNTTFIPTGNYNDPLYLGDSVHQNRVDIENAIKKLRVFSADGASAVGTPYTSGSCLDGSGNQLPAANAPCRSYPRNNDGYCFDSATNIPINLSDNTCFTPTPTGSPHIGPFTTDGVNFYERAFYNFDCNRTAPQDRSHCGTTNIGGAFNAAGQEFVMNPGFRQVSQWVVILLTDGVANHADGDLYCPFGESSNQHWCQDGPVKTINSGTRHCEPSTDTLYAGNSFLFPACKLAPPDGGGGTVDSTLYDADDYARDMADFVALGQQALIYTIGWGDAVGHGSPGSDWGEQLLSYAADIGDDGKINTPAGTLNPNYFYAPDATALHDIFQQISDRIATRLTH